MFDIDEFFRVSKSEVLPNDEVIWVRTLSELDIRARESYALGVVADMTARLRDGGSPEYRDKIAPLRHAPIDDIVETLVRSYRSEWAEEAQRLYPVLFFPYPENAAMEEKVETDRQQKEHEGVMAKNRLDYYVIRENDFRKKIADWEDDKLRRNVQERAVFIYAQDIGLEADQLYTLYRACIQNDVPHWKSVAEVMALNPKVTDRLAKVYREVDRVDPWSLTKSLSTRDVEGVDSGGETG